MSKEKRPPVKLSRLDARVNVMKNLYMTSQRRYKLGMRVSSLRSQILFLSRKWNWLAAFSTVDGKATHIGTVTWQRKR